MNRLFFIYLAFTVSSEKLKIPQDGKVYFGAWLDTSDNQAGDRPVAFNQRMNFKSTCFQYAQNLPNYDFDFPNEQVLETNSDACVMLTIYPKPNPWNITDNDIDKLTMQLLRLTTNEKMKMLLRIAPEMNGNWNEYGQQAFKYVTLWKRIVNYIRLKNVDISFVWAPSTGASYPYNPPREVIQTDNDLLLMDTNKDGIFDSNDNPYSAYYPGDEFVDWVGLSVYHYGLKYPWIDNIIAQPNNFASQLNDHSFYETYKHKPVMIAEGAVSFHKDTPKGDGVGELTMKKSFWVQWLTNNTVFEVFPQLKMVNLFEFTKLEEETLRDFSISVNETIRTEFLQDFQNVKDRYIMASFCNKINLHFTLFIFVFLYKFL